MYSTKVTVCLSREAWVRYSDEAQERRIPLATYVRQRLEEQDRFIAEITIRAACEGAASAGAGRPASPALDPGTLVEMLLLLRMLGGPQRSAMAQSEIERRGMSTWK